MTKTLLASAAFFILLSGAAEARKLSTMEWIDPQSIEIWQGLTDQDKVDSIKDYLSQQQPGDEKLPVLEVKVKACLDKEAADPDYKGVKVPMMIPASYCITKYNTILSAEKK